MQQADLLDRVVHAAADLDRIAQRLAQIQVADQRAQRPAVDILGDHMRLAHEGVQVVGAHDIWVAAQPHPQLGFGVEARDRFLIPQKLILKSLEHHLPAALAIVGDIHNAHEAAAGLLDLIALLDHVAHAEFAPKLRAVLAPRCKFAEQAPQHWVAFR